MSSAELLTDGNAIENLLKDASDRQGPTLWLVIDDGRLDHLADVLSPFKLMELSSRVYAGIVERSVFQARFKPITSSP